ncbi:NUDIX hydrolase [Paragemmobacter ruber]|uniref:NUDIX domain-containing protein n=1 Tax=Paragemmobacter ruber TaxID=1985673 RepID=A0ABW9Y2E6_9RHOB|nr:NUDIX domain-containing protein [Rhodobacter ruber]
MGETDARVRGQGVTGPGPDAEPIRPAATTVLLRRTDTGPQVLMGQRGAGAVFMPSKYVFPGGGVDPADHQALTPGLLGEPCLSRLAQHLPDGAPPPAALAAAALRELSEETGLSLAPTAEPALRFIFRAITPPGRSRRFDARFFLIEASRIAGDPEDFSAASDELSHLHWIGTDAARALDLPFITEVVLAEIGALAAGRPDQGVPFFDNSGPVPTFRRLA